MAKDALIGQQFDEYRLDKLLGHGGMARVYRGFDVRLKRWVAIKVIDTPFQAHSEYIKRFEREAQAIAQLEHPNIVSIYRYGEVDTVLYIAMRFIEGSPLDALLRVYRADQDFIPFAEAEQLIQQICRALDYAHSRGVIHRDIKPANILIDREGNAVLSDFGLALLTSEGTRGEIFGTPHYIAPEQAMSSADVVPQSDLYAVGVIMYEMFTGQVPFTAQDPLDVALLHMTEPPPPPRAIRPELSPALEAVILKALAKKPAERYPNGRTLGQALRQALRLQRDATTQLAAPRLSMLERVALDLANRPLPPPPAEASSPKLANGSAGQQHDDQRTSVSPMRVPADLPAKKVSPLILAGIGAGLVLVLVAVLALVGFLTFRANASDDRSLQTGEVTSSPAGTSLPSTASLDAGSTPTADPVQPVEATASLAAQPGTTEPTGSVEGPVVVILTPEAVPATSTPAPSSTPTLPPPSPSPTPLPQPVPELV
ncbi:MAG TPA: serine/threonine-protein kinase, partial [Anaerolineae bacterium]|nr:serine/threonine-protein kinase [Anaerolineae bacterium]